MKYVLEFMPHHYRVTHPNVKVKPKSGKIFIYKNTNTYKNLNNIVCAQVDQYGMYKWTSIMLKWTSIMLKWTSIMLKWTSKIGIVLSERKSTPPVRLFKTL